jgi:membrane dipeptidase
LRQPQLEEFFMPKIDAVAIFDGHNDAVQHIFEYRDGGRDFLARSDSGSLDLPRATEGSMVGGLFAMFARPERPSDRSFVRTADGFEVRLADPIDPVHARNRIDAQFDALNRLVMRAAGKIRWGTSVDDIEAGRREGVFTIVLHMEGAEAIGADLDDLDYFYSIGLRSLGPVWSRPNIFGHGVPFAYPRSPDIGPGLTDIGRELIRACNRLGIMVDISHINERGFWDIASISTAPLVATHACAHAICRSTRNLTDKQLDAIRESSGIVGFNFSACDVRPDARNDENTPIDMVVEHLIYLVERLGEDHVGLGSDFDGAVMPRPLRDASCFPNLIRSLRAHGFNENTVRKIAFDNWMRVFRLSWR